MRSLTLHLSAVLAALALVSFGTPALAKPPRTIELTVTKKGFEPANVKVKKGEPITLQITREAAKTCATEIVIPGYGIEEELPLDKKVEVTFTPRKTGEITYGCAMDQMIGGVLTVE